MGKKIRTKSSSKKVGEVMEKKVAKVVEAVFLRDRRLTVSVGTAADFGKAKVGLSLSENVKEGSDILELVDSIYEELIEKLEEKFDDLCEKVGIDDEGDEVGDEGDEGEVDDEDSGVCETDGDESGTEDDDGDDITEEEVLKMKKSDLVSLIEEEGLDLDIKDYKKIGDLRKAVVDALFEEDDEGSDDDGDWDSDGDEGDDEWGDDD